MTNNKPIMKTPITYYGGKQKMLGAILPMIPEHNIYVEPFFGGGAVFWAKQPAPVEFINDIDGEVTNFYRVLQTDYPALKREVDSTLHSEHAHREARAIYRSPEGHSPVRRAWAVWTLSHQSFYAILDNTWKCGMTHNVAGQIQGRKASFTADYTRRLEHTSIFSRDALTVIRRADRPETFFYVDPPYFNSDMGHYGGYTEEDFGRLLEVLSEVKGAIHAFLLPLGVAHRAYRNTRLAHCRGRAATLSRRRTQDRGAHDELRPVHPYSSARPDSTLGG